MIFEKNIILAESVLTNVSLLIVWPDIQIWTLPEYLPILPTGTCILAGVLTNMPIIVDINTIDDKQCEPNNKTLNIVEMIKLNAEENASSS